MWTALKKFYEGYYNIIVTQYEPDSLKDYLTKNTVVYDKNKMNGKYQVGSGRIVAVTHDTPFVDISVSQTTEKINPQNENSSKNIRHKSRSTVTSGQYEQMKANLSHSKVYSKKSAMELVSKIAPGIRNRSFEDLSTRLWEGLNAYTTVDDKITFATDIAQKYITKITQPQGKGDFYL